jgi:hypothetical protein
MAYQLDLALIWILQDSNKNQKRKIKVAKVYKDETFGKWNIEGYKKNIK